MPRMDVTEMSFAKLYPLLVAKAVKKGRTREEVDQVTGWLTGYTSEDIAQLEQSSVTYGDFFRNAPAMNPARARITGKVCGVRVEEIQDQLMREIRYLDKLVDELAKGKTMEQILRTKLSPVGRPKGKRSPLYCTHKPTEYSLGGFIMKKDLTELVFILDRSGSMQGLEEDTIGGFNSMLEKQKREPGEAFVSTILFDDRPEVLHDRILIREVAPITGRDYWVRGCTALLDALGEAIQHIGNIHKYARSEDIPEHTLFVITTDGMENASRRYSVHQVQEMICHQQKKYGWEFLFLGANIDAVETAGRLGIAPERAVNYHSDSQGTRLNYEAVSRAASSVRASAPLGAGWKAEIEKDYRNRDK